MSAMNPTEPSLQAAINAAIGHIAVTAATAAERAAELLGGMASAATRVQQREAYLGARSELRRQLPSFGHSFDEALRAKIRGELDPRPSPQQQPAGTNWMSLSLVDDSEVEERMLSDRISQAISHECEWELSDLAAYMGALMRIGHADAERNPLRPDNVGAALYTAIGKVSTDLEMRKILARELGPVMAKAMRLCYAEIVRDLQARGIQPANMNVRSVEGPGSDRVISGYASLPRDEALSSGSHFDSGQGELSSRGTGPGSSQRGSLGRGAGAQAVADAEMMSLIRRLTFIASQPGGLDDAEPLGARGHGRSPSQSGTGRLQGTGGGSMPGALGGGTGGLRGDGLTGLMAVNLIRAHRDELRQASSGTLDHMVIDVVGSLFDQILSDSRVPPQMARQIARLQLPVLRVALSDASFFSSRKHPVRRFVNRIASLACAFDDFDDGPGRQFLARVGELVQEIIEGDFDQVDVYAAKLTLLEAFIAQQNESDVQSNGATASLLDGKESDLRVQQRYMQQLHVALAPLAMQDYLRDFLWQVWSQALVLAARRDGPAAERTQRLRRAASELVLSVQPKGTPALRKTFLMQLPGLMKTLNEGMALIGLPEEAQKEFFGKLLPAHAESLKGQPMSDLDRNMLAKQLEAAFDAPLPRADQVSSSQAGALDAAAIEPHFSAEEVKRVGLVTESAVDWDGKVDIDLSADVADTLEPQQDVDPGVDIDLSVATADPAEPSQGPQLIDHLRLGFAYQMHLKDKWQKVRLSYVSQGRTFFVFTHGRGHQETLSLTARMLARMCDTNRLRAVESSYLLERATARARRQLAAMKTEAAVAH